MTIVVTNDCGCLIEEKYYETDDPNDAIREFVTSDDTIFAIGDMIQIRE